MVDLNDVFQPNAAHERDRLSVPALLLAPAVLRIVITGKDIETELDALVTAVAILQGSDGFMRRFIYEMAESLAQEVEEAGIRGLAAAVETRLDPEEAAMAFQIALVAVHSSPLGDDGDIGVLSAIAERTGMSEDQFAAAFDSARNAVASSDRKSVV